MTLSPFYTQHVDVDAPRVDHGAFRPYWRIRTRTRLDRLLADGAISVNTWRAAMRFRAAVYQAAGADRGFDRNRSAMPRASNSRDDAIVFVRRVRAVLGVVAVALIWSCVVDDAPWSTVGAKFRVDPKTARRWTVVALEALASIEQRRTPCAAIR